MSSFTIPLLTTHATLIRIPPPTPPQLSAANASLWNDEDLVWQGTLRILELEDFETGDIVGVLEFGMFGNTVFDPVNGVVTSPVALAERASSEKDGASDSQTLIEPDLLKCTGKNKWRTLILYKEKKVALGLVLPEGIEAEVLTVLGRLRRDKLLSLGENEDDDDKEISQLVDEVVHLEVSPDEKTEDDEDDFGDFIG